MSSVQDYRMCPQCKFKYAIFDYYCKSGAEYIFCERCGYSYRNDQQGEVETFGVGSFKIMPERGAGVSGSFSTQEAVTEFLKHFKEGKLVDDDGIPPAVLTFTFQKAGEWFIRDLIKDEVKPFPINLFPEEDE